ncbi:hypothetical protein REH65_13945 [Saccharopolyspora sp. ID03-671]|uniref:hypothetical protein n=1 Tax=Saccharopolyspora sp. ID03-671 TaxID=3073066 RepID=UPI003249E9D4
MQESAIAAFVVGQDARAIVGSKDVGGHEFKKLHHERPSSCRQADRQRSISTAPTAVTTKTDAAAFDQTT